MNSQATVTTATSYEYGNATWLGVLILCFVFLPIFWLPFCVEPVQDVIHSCPSCRRVLGRFDRLQNMFGH